MHFLHPEFLYYMLPPMFILFGLLLTQKSTQEVFFSKEVMEKLRVSANTLTLKARNALFLLIGILIVIALAAPVIDEGTIQIKAKSADIMIALDISDSMLAEDVYPNRLNLAKEKALELLKLAPTERLGVIAFAKNSYLVSPLSFDSQAVAFLLSKLSTESITEKGTNFLSMLDVVNNSIKSEDKKYLLILSDGGDSSDFTQEITYAKEKNIAVFVLGIGTSKGAPIKRADGSFITQNGEVIVSKLNDNIKELAIQTGGVYIQSVNSNADIVAMLKEIESHSEKKELKSQEIKRFIPLFYYPLGLALLLLLIATSSMSKRQRVNMPGAFLLALLAFSPHDVNAGVLDFLELEEAKNAYKAQEYKKSEKLYEKYQTQSQKPEVHYNIGNTLYKQGQYKEALVAYKKALFDDVSMRARNYANMGNAYVKAGEKEGLQKAVESYEKSLKLIEDKNTRENLEAVKKALQEQKKQEQKQDENRDEKKEQKDKKSDKDSQGKKKEDKDKKNQENQKEKEKKDKQEKQQEQKDKEKQEKSEKDKEQKKQEEKESKEKQQEQKNKEKTKELEDNNSSMQQAAQNMKNKMSEAEEKKWLKALNREHKTYLYKLNTTQKMEDNSNEKPW